MYFDFEKEKKKMCDDCNRLKIAEDVWWRGTPMVKLWHVDMVEILRRGNYRADRGQDEREITGLVERQFVEKWSGKFESRRTQIQPPVRRLGAATQVRRKRAKSTTIDLKTKILSLLSKKKNGRIYQFSGAILKVQISFSRLWLGLRNWR